MTLPIEIKKAQGTQNVTRERRNSEPTYQGAELAKYDPDTGEVTLPMAPDDLSDAAKELWDRNGYQLAVMGLFPNTAMTYLHTYCRLWDESEKAFEEFRGERYVYSEKGFKSINPAFKVYMAAIERMEAIGAKFAFTPLDKTKINMRAIEGDTKDKNKQKKIGVGG